MKIIGFTHDGDPLVQISKAMWVQLRLLGSSIIGTAGDLEHEAGLVGPAEPTDSRRKLKGAKAAETPTEAALEQRMAARNRVGTRAARAPAGTCGFCHKPCKGHFCDADCLRSHRNKYLVEWRKKQRGKVVSVRRRPDPAAALTQKASEKKEAGAPQSRLALVADICNRTAKE